MKKLKLSLESLQVSSFSTLSPEGRSRGTIRGNSDDTLSTYQYTDTCATTLVWTLECNSGYRPCVGTMQLTCTLNTG